MSSEEDTKQKLQKPARKGRRSCKVQVETKKMFQNQHAVFAVVGKKFVMITADMSQFKNDTIVVESNVNKLTEVADNIIVSSVGNAADVAFLAEFAIRQYDIHRFRAKIVLSPKATANCIAKYIAEGSSKRNMKVSSLVAGFDKLDGPSLHLLDTYGGMEQLTTTGMLGLAGLCTMTVMDRDWYPGITQDEAYWLIKKSVRQIQHRMAYNLPCFAVAVVDCHGRRDLPTIKLERLVLDKYRVTRPEV